APSTRGVDEGDQAVPREAGEEQPALLAVETRATAPGSAVRRAAGGGRARRRARGPRGDARAAGARGRSAARVLPCARTQQPGNGAAPAGVRCVVRGVVLAGGSA